MRYICFMSNLIFCPHTDDAIFSLGSYILNNKNFTIASAFAGIPTDNAGYKKHTVLRGEHKEACNFINAKEVNGNLLDDVYGKQDKSLLVNWIEQTIRDHDTPEVLNLNVFLPLGIHHPDHIFLSDCLYEIIKKYNCIFFLYAELPYRVLYPELYEERLNKFKSKYKITQINTVSNNKKLDAIKFYDSQIDENLIKKLLVEENLWRIDND
jgi:hypothetical protein